MTIDRFAISADSRTMKAVLTVGIGGYGKLVYRDVPVPVPGPCEVLVRVGAAGVNNTEINTRLGWYSSAVVADTATAANAETASAPQKAMQRGRARMFKTFIWRWQACGTWRKPR